MCLWRSRGLVNHKFRKFPLSRPWRRRFLREQYLWEQILIFKRTLIRTYCERHHGRRQQDTGSFATKYSLEDGVQPRLVHITQQIGIIGILFTQERGESRKCQDPSLQKISFTNFSRFDALDEDANSAKFCTPNKPCFTLAKSQKRESEFRRHPAQNLYKTCTILVQVDKKERISLYKKSTQSP